MVKIVLAEDEEALSNALTIALKKSGHTVINANNGDEALKKIKEHRPDIVLLDVIMPHKTGWDVMEKIHDDKELSKIPVIIMSNIETESRKMQFMDLGAVGYLIKSNESMQTIIDHIEEILGKNN